LYCPALLCQDGVSIELIVDSGEWIAESW
jgi:hypothetical protein